MGSIFYITGKSSTGKDTIYENLIARPDLALRPLVMYTTRPIRANETEGVQYHFVAREQMERMKAEGRVIEERVYQTVFGPWYYFTADTESIDLAHDNYLALGTLESYRKIRDYYGEERVYPICIQVEDVLRLERSIKREKKQEHPNYDEVCRRFLADQRDFSEEKMKEAGITRRFLNNGDRAVCMEEVAAYIRARL